MLGYLQLTGDVVDAELTITVDSSATLPDESELRLLRFPTASEGGPPTRAEQILFAAIPNASTDVPLVAVTIPPFTGPVHVEFGEGDATILTNVNDVITGEDPNQVTTSRVTVARGVYTVTYEGDFTPDAGGSAITFDILDARSGRILSPSTSPRLQESDMEVHRALVANLVLNEDTQVSFRAHREGGNRNVAVARGLSATFVRWGGGTEIRTERIATFEPTDLGEHTFNLTGVAAEVALTDSSGTAIICPADGYIVATLDVPGLGLIGAVQWMLAADLRAAVADTTLTAGLYTNDANQIFFHAGTQSGAVNGNTILIQRIGDTRDDTGGAQSTILPSIARFDVTGDLAPAPGDIGGDSYTYSLAISQSGHASAARIVGFAGTAANPQSVAVLRNVTTLHAETGTFAIPAGTMLAAAGDTYTIRLEVYGTGVAVTNPPTAYHDARITARTAATASVHFGDIPATEGASDITDFTDDIATGGSIFASWSISGIVAGDGNRRLYWLVPTSLDQPGAYRADGFDISSSVEAAVEITINSVAYNAYLTEADGPYDSTSNGYTITISES